MKNNNASVKFIFVLSLSLFVFQAKLFAANTPYLSVKNQEKAGIFVIPAIRVVRIESDKTIDVHFLDSCNLEKTFRLYRKSINGAWVVLDSQTNCSPDSMVWRVFHDKTPIANTWYSYKVQAYNTTLLAFSPETTVYNYVQPDNNQKYTISLLSSIPANPVSWVERLGDSLFFPERQSTGDTQIAVIDISKPQSPQFKSRFKQNEVPTKLKNSIIDARIKLHPGNVFFKALKGYYLIFADSTLYQYDSTTQQYRDSIKFTTNYASFAGIMSDSCFLLGCHYSDGMAGVSFIKPVSYSKGGFNILYDSLSWYNVGMIIGRRQGACLGCFEKKVVINMVVGGYTPVYSYYFYDFSSGYTNPLLFKSSEDTIQRIILNNSNPIFDRKTGLFYTKIYYQNVLSIYAIDLSNAYCGYNNNLGMLVDSTFKSFLIISSILDTLKKQLIISGDSTISIYSYTKSAVGINSPKNKTNHNSNKISVIQSFHGINFIHSFNQQMYLEIFDVKGRIIRQIISLPHKPLFWDKRDINNRPVALGVYFFKIHSKGNTRYSGSLIITQ